MPEIIDTERNVMPARGARFFRDEAGEVAFEFVVDPSNVIGPRPATRPDSEKHPEAWSRFIADEQRSPLDRDAEAGPGGSLPSETVPAPATTRISPAHADEAQIEALPAPRPTPAAAKSKRKYTKRRTAKA